MTRWLSLLALPVLLVAAVACGGDDDDDPTPSSTSDTTATSEANSTGEASPTQGNPGERLSDTDYLTVICTGTEEFAAALEVAETVEELSDVLSDFIANLQQVSPPEDLDTFHGEFITYLEDALDDPTSTVAVKPPLPPDDVRDRLVALEPSVDACRNPTFFSQ